MSSLKDLYVGSYRLLNQLATGQSTEIWEAIHDSSRRRVAIKRLQNVARNRKQRAFLRHEYAVGAKLEHPRVITIDELGQTKRETFLVMELFAVPNLKQLIYGGVQKVAHLAARIIDQTAEALAYLTEQGWVHCDVKPDNFLVSPQGDVKLIDFALAVRPKTGLSKMLALKGKPQGTMSYMPPEQILGKPVDFKADVYSLGCTVYELASGKKPFTGMSTNELLQKHIAGQIPALEAANRNVTPEFSALIRRCLSKEPSERPSLADFRRELSSIAVFKVRPKSPHELSLATSADAQPSPAVPRAETPRAEDQPAPAPSRRAAAERDEFNLDEMFAQAALLRSSDTVSESADSENATDAQFGDSDFDLDVPALRSAEPTDVAAASGGDDEDETSFDIEPQQIEPQQIEPQQIEPQQIEPQQIEPQQIEPQQIEPQQVEPKQAAPPRTLSSSSQWKPAGKDSDDSLEFDL